MTHPLPAPKRKRTRRRKFILGTVIVFALMTLTGGAYAFHLIDTIVNAEKNSVVPLPTRSTEFAASVPTRTPTTVATAPLVPTTTIAPGATSRPTIPGNLTVPAETATAPSITAATQTPAPTATGAATATTAAANPTAVVPSATYDLRPLPTGDDPSRFDVLQNLWAAVGSDDPSTSSVWGGKSDIYLMLLGVDRRPDGGDQNADVILIVHVDLIHRKVSAVSIPRDLLVDIPGIGQDKINSAYNYGYKADPTSKVSGVALMRDTIESVFQVPIDGYVLLDFNGFTDVVDEMGGVQIDVPSLLIDPDYPTADYGTETVTFLPGPQKMDGETALKYVRTRHQDSDDGRRERQIQVLRALFARAKSFDSLTNGFQIISALGDTVQTGFTLEQQLTLAKLGYDMQDADIYTASLTGPLITGGYQASGAWAYTGDAAEIMNWVQQNLATDPQPVVQSSATSVTSSEFAGTPEVSPTAYVPSITSGVQPTPTTYVPSISVPTAAVTPAP